MSDPFVACLFVISLSSPPHECSIQPPPPVAFVERWGRWPCNKEMTECRPAPDVPSVAHGEQQRYDKSTLYAFNWRRLSEGSVRDQNESATDVRDSATDVHESAIDVHDRATDVHLNLESNPGTKTGNLTLPGGESEQPPLDSKTGDQHPITDIAQADPSITGSDFHIAQADPSDIGNRIAQPTDIEQAFAQFWQHYPATNHSEPAHVVRPVFLAAVKAGIDTNAIITGASRYAAARAGKDPQYTRSMTNWLKRRYWEADDKLPDRVSTTTIDQHGHPIPAPSSSRSLNPFQQSVRNGIARGLTQTSLFIRPVINGKDHNHD